MAMNATDHPVFTIGFTKKNSRQFFDALRKSGAKRVVDVRLNNLSQLAGFAKRDDFAFSCLSACHRTGKRPWLPAVC